MAKSHVITIGADAAVEFVHSDAILQESVARARVERLSEVEFEDGEWVARDAETGAVIARSPRRAEAIAGEVRHFQERQRAGESLVRRKGAGK